MAMYPCLSLPPISFPSVSGAVCSFDSQYAGLPLKSHKIALTATQSGSGTPSPENERTINGYSAINISHSGADTSTPTVYTINLGGTYYGGEYDARMGIFTATHGMKTIRDLSWNYVNVAGNERFYSATIDSIIKVPESTRVLPDLLCESYKTVTYDDYVTFSFNNIITLILDGKVVIRDTNYTSMADFVNNMGDVKIVFRLATPTTIQLPPCPIDTLEGVNNIWADTGDTTIQYIKLG